MNEFRILIVMLLSMMVSASHCQTGPFPPDPGTGGTDEWPDWDQTSAGTGGARPSPVGFDDCSKAEDYAFKMGCPLKKPKRATWAEACRNGRANGVDMQDDCVLGAHDCGGIHYCVENSAP